MIPLSKPKECTTPRVKRNVNYGLSPGDNGGSMKVYQFNKCTTWMGILIMTVHVWGWEDMGNLSVLLKVL